MAAPLRPIGAYSPFAAWNAPDPDAGAGAAFPAPVAPVAGLVTNTGLPSMTAGGGQVNGNNITDQALGGSPTTNYAGLVGAGIGAAGTAASGVAQAAAQQAILQQQQAQSAAGNALSEKLAKLSLGQAADQFAKNQKLQALMWAMGANGAASKTAEGSRDIRRQDTQMLSDILARLYMPRR